MPLYEYQCESCNKVTEKIQKFSDPLLEICPSCGGPVKKLLSSPAFHLKGSGWYLTDYARKSGDGKTAKGDNSESSEKAEKSEKSEQADKSEKSEKSEKTEKSDTAKTDSKPASTTKSE
jgi:putative FmdB family regulatory protein